MVLKLIFRQLDLSGNAFGMSSGIMKHMPVSLKNAGVGAALAVLFMFWGSAHAYAALLYLVPASSTFQPGETATLDLRIDPQGECINAAGIDIGFPKDLVQAVDVSRGNSIF